MKTVTLFLQSRDLHVAMRTEVPRSSYWCATCELARRKHIGACFERLWTDATGETEKNDGTAPWDRS